MKVILFITITALLVGFFFTNVKTGEDEIENTQDLSIHEKSGGSTLKSRIQNEDIINLPTFDESTKNIPQIVQIIPPPKHKIPSNEAYKVKSIMISVTVSNVNQLVCAIVIKTDPVDITVTFDGTPMKRIVDFTERHQSILCEQNPPIGEHVLLLSADNGEEEQLIMGAVVIEGVDFENPYVMQNGVSNVGPHIELHFEDVPQNSLVLSGGFVGESGIPEPKGKNHELLWFSQSSWNMSGMVSAMEVSDFGDVALVWTILESQSIHPNAVWGLVLRGQK